jgi:hypothetical protein
LEAESDIYVAPAATVGALHEQLYRGEIVRFSDVPAMRAGLNEAKAILENIDARSLE